MRCVCCNRELLKGEYDKYKPDGTQEDMCKPCVRESSKPYNENDLEYVHKCAYEGLVKPIEVDY